MEESVCSMVFVNKLNTKKVVYSQDVQWMDGMYGNHLGIQCKIPMNQDYLSDEEESDEEDDPVQLKTNDTELSEQEKTQFS